MSMGDSMDKATLKIGLALGIVVTIGLLVMNGLFHWRDLQIAAYESVPTYAWGWVALSITLLLAMVITLFGLLALPGARTDEGTFREERVRFAIAATLLVVYFVLFCNAVLFGEGDKSINTKMMDTLTTLMTIVLPFYFGTSGLVEWSKQRGERSENTSNE
jgi:Ca2+/Na+ antiporter